MEEKVDGLGYNNRMALYFVAAFLFVSSAFLPDEMALLKERSLASVAMILLGLLADAFLLFSVYITAEPVVPRHKDRLTAMLLSAAMLFACPGALVFSEIHIAAIALLWAQFCLLKEEYFMAFFLMGISSMFFPPVLWVALLVIVLMLLAGLTDKVRNILKFLGGLLVPYLLYFGFLFVRDGNLLPVVAAGLSVWAKMTSITLEFFSLGIPKLFLVFCLLVMCLHATLLFMSKMSEYGIAESYALKVQIINVAVSAAIFILFSSAEVHSVAILACCPVAVLLSRYFSQYGSSPFLRVEIVILLCALVVSRLGNFIV